MFSTEEFIEASRDFVCIRIETYENKESEELVKKVLHGKYANTAFVICNPQGTKPLTRSGRSPGMAMINGRSRTETGGSQNDQILSQMSQIASQFKAQGSRLDAELQDFNSLRQALNCASADQRLLVLVNAHEKNRAKVELKLKSVFADEEIVGKFHLNFVNDKVDRAWPKVIQGAKDKPSIIVIRSGQFGLDGQAIDQLELNQSEEEIKDSLLKANKKFAKVEQRKEYEAHVRAGRRQKIVFENEIGRSGSEDGAGRTGGRDNRRNR